MAESEPNSHLAAHGDSEVERLLREAESLTQDVARETGTPVRDADALLSGEFSAAPDPLAAVDAASSSIMSLEDLLSEMGPGDSPGESQASLQARHASPQIPSKPASSPVPQDTRLRMEPRKSHSVDIPAPRSGPRDEHIPSDEAGPGEQVRLAGEDSPGDPKERQESAGNTEASKAPRLSLGRRVLQFGKSGSRGLLTAVLVIVRDVPIGVLSSVDLPFRRTPRSIKNAIGIIGAITLGMGALAWALPGLMKPSPPSAAGTESHESAPAAHDSGQSGGH